MYYAEHVQLGNFSLLKYLKIRYMMTVQTVDYSWQLYLTFVPSNNVLTF